MFVPRPRALLIDVGFTLTSYDATRVAEIATEAGVTADPAALEGCERVLRSNLGRYAWASRPDSTAPRSGGVGFFRHMLELSGAGALPAALDAAAELVWSRHLERNLWARVLDRVPESLGRLRDAGLLLAVISNSEGTVEAMLREVGLRGFFEVVLDSWVVGISKPDPRIFKQAIDHLGVEAGDAVMVGDSPTADIGGARTAGVRGALLDPFGFHADVPAQRFPGFGAFADALLDGQRRQDR